MQNDTIAAIATPPATGAVGIVRLSGAGAFAAADRVFSPDAATPLSAMQARTLHTGSITAPDGAVIDRAMAVRFAAPRSYTGEDCVELHCHGGLRLLRQVLDACLRAGARQAAAGEFTKRAFLNGKLDLTGAEAAADLIHAETDAGVRNAAAQLTGRLYEELEEIESALTDAAAHYTAYIEYTEEGVEPPDWTAQTAVLSACAVRLTRLAESYDQGRLFTEGVRCVLAGRPNVGKSSLLNRLCGYDRAIVTDTPGTTRDTVEESIEAGAVLLRVTDTAGLRADGGEIEQLGMERTRRAAADAGLLLAVFDASVPWTEDDRETIRLIEQATAPVICVWNKCDRGIVYTPDMHPAFAHAVCVSAQTGEGMDALQAAVETQFRAGTLAPDGRMITNRRQADALQRAAALCTAAADALDAGFTPDVAWIDAEAALRALGEVTGKTADAEILSRVFARFCVGK